MYKSGWYYYSWTVWGLCTLLSVLAWFLEMSMLFAFPFFLIFPEWIAMIIFGIKAGLPQQKIFKECPKRIKIIAGCSIFYGIVNAAVGFCILGNGDTFIENGVYYFGEGGLIQEISYDAFQALSRVKSRLFAGGMQIFASVSAMFFAAKEEMPEHFL